MKKNNYENAVTNVTINWTNTDKKSTLVAVGNVELNGCIKINVSVMNGKNGKFVTFPSRKGKDGKYYNDVFISDENLFNTINDEVLAEL